MKNILATLAADPEIREQVWLEQTRQLYRGGIMAGFAVIIGVVLLVAALSPYVGMAFLLPWGIALAGLMLLRMGLIWWYFRQPAIRRRVIRWRSVYRLTVFIAGLLWAILPWQVMPQVAGHSEAMLYVLLISVVVVSLGVHVLAIDAISATLYVSPLMIAIALRFYQGIGGLSPAMSLWMPAYLLFINLAIMLHYRIQIANLVLRFDNERLLAQAERDRHAAEQADEAKGQFLAVMSHEIRTPLNAVSGMVSLLEETAPDSRQQHYLNNIRIAANGLLKLVNDILNYSRGEAGELTLTERVFPLREWVNEVSEPFAIQAREAGLYFKRELADDLPAWVYGDPDRLGEILGNLLGNALKFTREGGVRLKLSGESGEDRQLILHMEIADTGIGIAPDRQEAIFLPYTQADASISRTHGGTGLGLAIVRQLVERMGGEIRVSSAPGAGARFQASVVLRVAQIPEGVAAGLAEDDAPLPGRPCVLLAEDNPINREIGVAMLESLGCRVDVATDGVDVVEKAARGGYDILFMDCNMPKCDGFDATRRIRAREQGAEASLPIIALTANVEAGVRQHCVAAGMDDYLSKPFARRQLAACLRRWLSPATPAETGG